LHHKLDCTEYVPPKYTHGERGGDISCAIKLMICPLFGERETGVDGGWFLGSRWNFLGLFNYALTNFFILEF